MLLHDIILRKIIFSVTKWENLHVNTVLITRVFDPEYVIISYFKPRAPKVFNPSKSRWMSCIYPKIMRSIDLIHRLAILARADNVGIDGITAMSRGISGGKQVIKSANTRNHDWICFNLDNRKWRIQNAVATVDFFTARNYDVKLVETRTVHVVDWEIDLSTSWAHFFSWALSVSGRFRMFSATIASERAGGLGPTTRKSNWERINKLDCHYSCCQIL